MTTDQKMVNVGTPEQPELVPQEAVTSPDSPKGRGWWGRLAEGAVILSQAALGKLIQLSNEKKD